MEENYNPSFKTNYLIAQSYYYQKRKNFNTFMKNKIEKEEEFFANKLTELTEKTWRTEIFDKMSNIFNIEKTKPFRYKFKNEENRNDFEKMEIVGLTEEMKNKIIKGAENGGNFQSIMGFVFEDFIKTAMKDVEELIKLEIDKVGDRQSLSALTKGKKNIRPDLGIGIEINPDEKDILHVKNSQLPVELQILYDIELEKSEGRIQEVGEEYNFTNAKTLKDYLKANSFGFSLKNWDVKKRFTNKEYTSSVRLQNIINIGLKNINNADKASMYVNNEISKYIFNIVNPLTICIIFSNGYQWMDEFLSTYYFSMELFKNKSLNNNYTVEKPGIILKLYNINKLANFTFTTSLSKKEESKDYYKVHQRIKYNKK